jgi:hypothetical protein
MRWLVPRQATFAWFELREARGQATPNAVDSECMGTALAARAGHSRPPTDLIKSFIFQGLTESGWSPIIGSRGPETEAPA